MHISKIVRKLRINYEPIRLKEHLNTIPFSLIWLCKSMEYNSRRFLQRDNKVAREIKASTRKAFKRRGHLKKRLSEAIGKPIERNDRGWGFADNIKRTGIEL